MGSSPWRGSSTVDLSCPVEPKTRSSLRTHEVQDLAQFRHDDAARPPGGEQVGERRVHPVAPCNPADSLDLLKHYNDVSETPHPNPQQFFDIQVTERRLLLTLNAETVSGMGW